MKDVVESFKTPLWLTAAVIAAWGAWMINRRKKNKQVNQAETTM